jgi:hypothetical protein
MQSNTTCRTQTLFQSTVTTALNLHINTMVQLQWVAFIKKQAAQLAALGVTSGTNG